MYYVDRYLGELVTEKDDFAAPERYYEYRKGSNDQMVIETYIVSYKPLKLIDFSWTTSEDRRYISIARDIFLEANGASKNAVLYAYTVPPKWYEEEVAKVN